MATDRKFQALDDNFEHFLDTVLIEFVETDFTPEKRKARRKRADKDDLAFCEIYYPNIFTMEWNALHQFVAGIHSGMWTLSGFRKCGKSASVYVAKAVKALALGVGGIVNINARTQEISIERTAALKRLIERNRLLCYDYDIEIQQDLKGHYIIKNTHLISGSVKTGLRNLIDDEFKRIRIAINDDLYNKDTVTSEYDNAKVVDFVESEVRGQLEEGGLSITMGNSISSTCPIVQLQEKHPDHHFSLPALDEEDESTWPEYKTSAEWRIFQKDIPWDIWLGEYMDKPALKGDVFNPDDLRGININTLQIIASISALDPSHGQSPSACFKGLATVGITTKQEVIVEDIYLRKEGYPAVFDYVLALSGRMPNWKALLFENDFNQWAFAYPYYRDWMRKRKTTLPIVRHLAGQLQTQFRGADKESRILNLVHPHQTGMLLYNEAILNTADFKRFRAQFLGFGKAREKLDGLDALATAYIMIFRYTDTGGFKPLKERLFQGGMSWFRKA